VQALEALRGALTKALAAEDNIAEAARRLVKADDALSSVGARSAPLH
jgi:hypothetical protein